MSDRNNLIILKELTEKLPTLISMTNKNGNIASNVVELKSGDTTIVLIGIVKNKEYAICKTIAPKEGKRQFHVHEGNEWLIVLKGKMEMFYGKNKPSQIIDTGGYVFIPSGTLHDSYYIENTELLAITIPPDPAFPEGGNYA